MSTGTLDNRNRMVEFMAKKDMVIMNTTFEKEDKLLYTHIGSGTDYGDMEELLQGRTGQIDFTCISHTWRNKVVNAETDITANRT